jgi:hypothetical protein
MKKLDDKRYGPFKVLARHGSAYKLELPRTWHGNIHNVFNEVLLTPYHPLSFPSQCLPSPPPPIQVNSVDVTLRFTDMFFFISFIIYSPPALYYLMPEPRIILIPSASIRSIHVPDPLPFISLSSHVSQEPHFISDSLAP